MFARLFGVAFVTVVGLVVWFRADVLWMHLVTTAVIMSVIYLSVTVITGMAGQISLCQGAFGAIGGFTVFQMADRFDMSVLAAALLGAAAAAAVGAVLSLPVLRLGGVWLAIATLAFAFFFDGGGREVLLGRRRLDRPADRHSGAPAAARADRLRRRPGVSGAVGGRAGRGVGGGDPTAGGTVGRTLAALRGSEVAAASIGISAARARIVAFAVSAAIAGLGGALLSMHQENVNYGASFGPVSALFWLVIVVALGARTVEGAIQAGAAFALFEPLVLQGELFAWMLRGR